VILTTRPALLSDALWIGERLRPEDKREVETLAAVPAVDAVQWSFACSAEVYTWRLQDSRGRIEEGPAAIFGVTPGFHEGTGCPWLVATSEIIRAPISILREAQHWMDHFHQKYPQGLFNLVDARNGLHLRWLWLLGFKELGRHSVRGNEFVHVHRG
jgi:hypothetical protein